MTVLRGFTITATSALAFTSVGAVAGYLVGILAPDYYRIVFGIPLDSPVNLPQFGLVLGALQGTGVGTITGLIIVSAVTWFNSRVR
ncbi:MAG: hypothetical protein WCJ09_02785 [Planctomycetota bacterium]